MDTITVAPKVNAKQFAQQAKPQRTFTEHVSAVEAQLLLHLKILPYEITVMLLDFTGLHVVAKQQAKSRARLDSKMRTAS